MAAYFCRSKEKYFLVAPFKMTDLAKGLEKMSNVEFMHK